MRYCGFEKDGGGGGEGMVDTYIHTCKDTEERGEMFGDAAESRFCQPLSDACICGCSGRQSRAKGQLTENGDR